MVWYGRVGCDYSACTTQRGPTELRADTRPTAGVKRGRPTNGRHRSHLPSKASDRGQPSESDPSVTDRRRLRLVSGLRQYDGACLPSPSPWHRHRHVWPPPRFPAGDPHTLPPKASSSSRPACDGTFIPAEVRAVRAAFAELRRGPASITHTHTHTRQHGARHGGGWHTHTAHTRQHTARHGGGWHTHTHTHTSARGTARRGMAHTHCTHTSARGTARRGTHTHTHTDNHYSTGHSTAGDGTHTCRGRYNYRRGHMPATAWPTHTRRRRQPGPAGGGWHTHLQKASVGAGRRGMAHTPAEGVSRGRPAGGWHTHLQKASAGAGRRGMAHTPAEGVSRGRPAGDGTHTCRRRQPGPAGGGWHTHTCRRRQPGPAGGGWHTHLQKASAGAGRRGMADIGTDDVGRRLVDRAALIECYLRFGSFRPDGSNPGIEKSRLKLNLCQPMA